MRKLLVRALVFAERVSQRFADSLFPVLVRYGAPKTPSAMWPNWAPTPLGSDRTKPELGWPRRTDSLCPDCVKELRASILDGSVDVSVLTDSKPAEIQAEIREEQGRLIMRKSCPRHGAFEDVISIDPEFSRRMESLFPGRDFKAPPSPLRRHGSSSIKYGRGAVLTVDLTNRCNMMCDPCFMDANQVGYVHELDWEDIKKILDDSLTVQPRRQMSVQFSGGEPTLSPHFLQAISYAREIGYFCVQCASNGVLFAQDPGLCRRAKDAGLRLVYLQFDGTTNQAHAHRKVGNLFDVKQAAIENLHAAGIDVVLVVTVVRGINDQQVGPVVRYAINNADKITVVAFQPVSFTGRDEDISDSERVARRYTLSHLARDLNSQLRQTEPLRDWFPLSAMNPFSDVVDLLAGVGEKFGALKCGCHPNCGVGTVLLVNKHTKEMIPLPQILDVDRLLGDVQTIADAQLGHKLAVASLVVAVLRNFRPHRAPQSYRFPQLVKQLISQIGARGGRVGASEGDAAEFPWRFLFVAGMWFQDLWNYDFRRTEMCIIPYGTQLGEISFCAYNTGVGWRQIVEDRFRTATVADWYRTRGRHSVYARGQDLDFSVADTEAPSSSSNVDRKYHLRLVG